ncbi:unnamed protein product [Rhizophagus irregularis]|nr:unnamed protein product [Rhizophagus irregularis]
MINVHKLPVILIRKSYCQLSEFTLLHLNYNVTENQFNYEPQSSLRGKRRKRRNRRIPSGNKRTSVPVKYSLFLYYRLKYPGIYFHPG